MNQKHVLLLIGTLGVLLVAAWLSGIFSGPSSTVDVPEISMSAGAIESIVIRKGEKSVELSKRDGAWYLVEPVQAAADTGIASRLLNQLENLRIESVVSSRSDRYARFQVDSSSATFFAFDGPTRLAFWIGKTGPDFQSRYIRFDGDERVYLANGVPNGEVSVDRWRDKSLWDYPPASVSRVVVKTPESEYRLSKEAEGWMLEKDGRVLLADSAKVERYLGRIASVNADGFLLDASSDSVRAAATHLLEVHRLDGALSRLTIQKRDSDAAALFGDGDEVIKLFGYRVKNLVPGPEELLSESD